MHGPCVIERRSNRGSPQRKGRGNHRGEFWIRSWGTRAFAAEGARVVVSDIREEPLEGGFEEDADLTTVEAIEEDGGEGPYVGCDVTKQDQVRDLAEAAADRFGRLTTGVHRGRVGH
jgi:hypothetical protein